MPGDVRYDVVVAFTDKDQGFAFNGRYPWPLLKDDKQFVINVTTRREDKSKKNGFVTGRVTWESSDDSEIKRHPHLFPVVTSTQLTTEGDPYLQKVVPSLDEAITYFSTPPVSEQVEKFFILGGGRNYNIAINDPRLKRIWLTRVFGDFKANFFFPKFQHKFKRVRCETLDESLQEDQGIKYQFEVWERFAN